MGIGLHYSVYCCIHAAQFMYQRDQHEKHSLSSYFDEKERGSSTAAQPATTPVSPLATTVAIANPQSRKEQQSGGKKKTVCACMDVSCF